MTSISSRSSNTYRPNSPPVQRSQELPSKPPPAETQKKTPEKAPAKLDLHKNDTFEASPESKSQNFNNAAHTVQQPTDTSCGEGALATVNSANKGGESDQQLLNDVQKNADAINHGSSDHPVDLANGTNAQEMGQLLGQQGQEVTRAFGQFDSDALKEGTEKGKKGLMLVDANALENTQGAAGDAKKAEGKGDLHWITVDDIGEKKQADGSKEPVYTVKDSASNKDYQLSRDQMENIVNQAKNGVHHSGGGIVVKNRPDVDTQAEKDALSQENYKHVSPQTLGTGDGIGRDGRRESIAV